MINFYVQPEDLIKALIELENSASQDAVVREKIANLPAEVQDVSLLDKIEGTVHSVSYLYNSHYCTMYTIIFTRVNTQH